MWTPAAKASGVIYCVIGKQETAAAAHAHLTAYQAPPVSPVFFFVSLRRANCNLFIELTQSSAKWLSFRRKQGEGKKRWVESKRRRFTSLRSWACCLLTLQTRLPPPSLVLCEQDTHRERGRQTEREGKELNWWTQHNCGHCLYKQAS